MKTHQTTDGTDAQDAGYLDTTNDLIPVRPAAAAIRQKRLRCLTRSWRSGAVRALAVGVALVAPALHAQVSSSDTFTDDNWISLGALESWTDGTVYATATDPAGNLYIGGSFTHVGNMPANGIAKWDGSTWSALGNGVSGNVYALAFYGNGLYVGGEFLSAGGLEVRGIARWNGSTWAPLGSGIPGRVRALTILDNQLYAGGQFSTAGGVGAGNIAGWDGANWAPLGSGVGGGSIPVYALAVHEGELYAAGTFATAGGAPANRVARWDGSTWSSLGSGLSGGGGVVPELVSLGDDLYAGGNFTTAGGAAAANIARWDGTSWMALGSGTDGTVAALAAADNTLYVGGGFATAGGVAANRIATWDGNAWSALGAGFDDGAVRSIAVQASTIYAGGDFTATGGKEAGGIAIFEGSDWSFIPPGVSGQPSSPIEVNAFAVSEDALYVGGRFTNIEGVAANNIAKWDGSNWSSLGEGLNERVDSIAVAGSTIYAGGRFTMAGDVEARAIAKWDGTNWSALGSGMTKPDIGHGNNGQVYALGMLGSDLYAGGWFDQVGGIQANGLARWDGSNWSAVDTAPLGSGNAIAVVDSDLYVGGLGKAGGLTVNGIAKWDGSAWSSLGSGVHRGQLSVGDVWSLAASGKDLYVGGRFSLAGEIEANNIARWDGSSWSALGTGLDGEVRALAVHGADLYAMGLFTSAGGSPANHIAKWDGSTWSPLGSGITFSGNSTDYAVAIWRNRLFAGGQQRIVSAGGKPSTGIARAFLNAIPPLEFVDGTAHVFFREPDVQEETWHRIERTTDFETWEQIGLEYAGPTGGIDFRDAAAPEDKAFYLAVPVASE